MTEYEEEKYYDYMMSAEPVHEDCDEAHICVHCGDEIWDDEGGVEGNNRYCLACRKGKP